VNVGLGYVPVKDLPCDVRGLNQLHDRVSIESSPKVVDIEAGRDNGVELLQIVCFGGNEDRFYCVNDFRLL
jgi:hypothetical protein